MRKELKALETLAKFCSKFRNCALDKCPFYDDDKRECLLSHNNITPSFQFPKVIAKAVENEQRRKTI